MSICFHPPIHSARVRLQVFFANLKRKFFSRRKLRLLALGVKVITGHELCTMRVKGLKMEIWFTGLSSLFWEPHKGNDGQKISHSCWSHGELVSCALLLSNHYLGLS